MVFLHSKYKVIEDIDPEEVLSADCILLDWPDKRHVISKIRGRDYRLLYHRDEMAELKECVSMMEEFTKKSTEVLGLVIVRKSANGYVIDFAHPDLAEK